MLPGVAALLAAWSIGAAIDPQRPPADPAALRYVLLGAAFTAVAVWAPMLRRVPTWLGAGALGVGALAVVVQIRGSWSDRPAIYLDTSSFGRLHVVVAAALLAAVGLVLVPERLRVVPAALVAVAVLAGGAWIVDHSPAPAIDVYTFHQDAADALFAARDPYVADDVRFRNIYGSTDSYPDGFADARHVDVGYLYPPLSLVSVAAAKGVAGDPRWAHVLALAATAFLVALVAPGRAGALSGALGVAVLLTTPSVWFVLEQAWTEPLVLLALTATVCCAARWRPGLPFALGALVVTKQYALVLLPLAVLLVPWAIARSRRFLVPLLGTAAVLTVPFVARHPADAWRSLVTAHWRQPFRADSLSLRAWWFEQGHGVVTPAVGLVVTGLIVVLCVCLAPRTPSGFAASAALVLTCLFLGGNSFANYYWLVVGALTLAVAASPLPTGERRCREGSDGPTW